MTQPTRFFTDEIQKDYRDYIATETELGRLLRLRDEMLGLAQTFGRLNIDYTFHLGRLIVEQNATVKDCKAAGVSPKMMRQAVKIFNCQRQDRPIKS